MTIEIHTIAGTLALLSGALVMILKKGNSLHKRVGYLYAGSMVLLTSTSFGIYELFDSWGPFHYMALVSQATLLAGLIPAWGPRNSHKWIIWHNKMMQWSFVGLVMATGSHIMGPFISLLGQWGLQDRPAFFMAAGCLWGIPMLIGMIFIERYNRKRFYQKAMMKG